jgi:hypothetical protein
MHSLGCKSHVFPLCLKNYPDRFGCSASTTFEQTYWSVNPTNHLPTPHVATVAADCPCSVPQMFPLGLSDSKHEAAAVWMYEPWGRNVECYYCHTKKRGDYGWVKCESNPANRHFCGTAPLDAAGKPLPIQSWDTETATMTATRTLPVFEESTLVQTVTTPYPYALIHADLARRGGSWHERISFSNPFVGGPKRFCGDIEHEKRGQGDKQEYRIQNVKAVTDQHRCDKAFNLDLEHRVETTAGSTTTTTETSVVDKTYSGTTFTTTTAYSLMRQAPRAEDSEPARGDL